MDLEMFNKLMNQNFWRKPEKKQKFILIIFSKFF